MMTFRDLSETEFESIYYQYMVNDFPENELKDIETIQKSFQRGTYACVVMEEDNEIRAYACFSWVHPDVQILDYLAVVSDIRGKGYGSQLLHWLKENPEVKEIILESEDPNFSKDESEEEIRIRRLSFYQKNGMKKRETSVVLGDVEFNIFTFDDSTLSEKELLKEMLMIYQQTSPNLQVIPY